MVRTACYACIYDFPVIGMQFENDKSYQLNLIHETNFPQHFPAGKHHDVFAIHVARFFRAIHKRFPRHHAREAGAAAI